MEPPAPMSPLIGISCSTLPRLTMPGMFRYSVPRQYVDGVVAAGGMPWILPNVAAESAPAYVERLDGLLLTGGADIDPAHYGQEAHPTTVEIEADRDAFELAAARAAYETETPLFAICRGAQLLNVLRGGTLIQDIPSQVEGALVHDQGPEHWRDLAHEVAVVPGTRLARILGVERLAVNTFHHQAVDRLAPGLRVTARSADGVVEGLEDPDHPFCVAVQWHPERRGDDLATRALFRAFVEAARHAPAPSS